MALKSRVLDFKALEFKLAWKSLRKDKDLDSKCIWSYQAKN